MDYAGLTRLSYLQGSPYLEDMKASGSYSEKQMNNVRTLFYRKSITYAQFSEGKMFKKNCELLYDTKRPENIPVLFLLSKDSCEKYKKSLAKRGYDVARDDLHKAVISNSSIQKIEFLDGQHYLQWSQSKKIAQYISNFLRDCK